MSPLEALSGLALDSYRGESIQFEVSLARLLPKLGVHLERARRIGDVRDVRGDDVRAWVDAALPDGGTPSLATRHNRRAAARLGFRLLREAGVVDHDPTVDIRLPPRESGREARPLTDDEVERGRAAAVRALGETYRPAVWALAEAAATTHEIPRVVAADVDLDAGTVSLDGSSKVEARIVVLTEWGMRALASRLSVLEPSEDDRLVAYQGRAGNAAARQATAATALGKILTDAGLRSDPTVKPGSVRAWRARRIHLETGRIEAAAVALGSGSLDTAAAIIGLDWRALR